jgi:hypothetical protein
MGRAGRPSKSGRRRSKSGRRTEAVLFDHGAEHVQRLRARFAAFQDGKAAQQVHDPIGRAWAVGLLENARIDPAVLRDAGRDYAARYWGYYPSAVGVANYLDEDRRGEFWAGGEDPNGEIFQIRDAQLKNAGRTSYEAVHSLCLDFYWFPDDNPGWLDRLIEARLGGAGQGDGEADAARMRAAVEGLLALAEGMKGGRLDRVIPAQAGIHSR